jgi:hypothetical protein
VDLFHVAGVVATGVVATGVAVTGVAVIAFRIWIIFIIVSRLLILTIKALV